MNPIYLYRRNRSVSYLSLLNLFRRMAGPLGARALNRIRNCQHRLTGFTVQERLRFTARLQKVREM